MKFILKIEPEAFFDIQEGIKWYNKQQKGLGNKFHKEVKKHFDSLVKNPFYEVKYDEIRCLPLKLFPYTIHYSVHETKRIIIIRAIFNTNQYPLKIKKR